MGLGLLLGVKSVHFCALTPSPRLSEPCRGSAPPRQGGCPRGLWALVPQPPGGRPKPGHTSPCAGGGKGWTSRRPLARSEHCSQVSPTGSVDWPVCCESQPVAPSASRAGGGATPPAGERPSLGTECVQTQCWHLSWRLGADQPLPASGARLQKLPDLSSTALGWGELVIDVVDL